MRLSNWSYSRYGTWKKCPAILRFQEAVGPGPSHPAAQRGTDLHAVVEKYLLQEIRSLPMELAYYTEFLDNLIVAGADPEMQIAIDAEWSVLPWDDPGRWWRGVLDCVVETENGPIIFDWKTGKEYADHRDQREIYAAAYYSVRPFEKITVMHVYLDHKVNVITEFNEEDVPVLREEWNKRVAPMLADEILPTNPGFHCRYCHFRRDNGGPCQF